MHRSALHFAIHRLSLHLDRDVVVTFLLLPPLSPSISVILSVVAFDTVQLAFALACTLAFSFQFPGFFCFPCSLHFLCLLTTSLCSHHGHSGQTCRSLQHLTLLMFF